MSETVTVACKLPNGIRIRGERKRTNTIRVASATGLHEYSEDQWTWDGREFIVRGNAVDLAETRVNDKLYVGALQTGFALTPGCPKDLWDQFAERMADSEMIKNRLIYAHKQPASAKAFAREHEAAVRSGLEPLSTAGPGEPARDPRLTNGPSLAGSVSPIQTGVKQDT